MVAMNGSTYEASWPRKKRRCRTSKKTRLRLKKRASLDSVSEGKRDDVDNNQQDESNTLVQRKIPDQENEQNHNTDKHPDIELQQFKAWMQEHCADIYAPMKENQADIYAPVQENQAKKHEREHDRHSDKAESSDSEHEEMASYEQKRRENILRNLAFMDQVGMSSAKLAARTAISDEFAKATVKARRQEVVSKGALELSKLPRRKSQQSSGEHAQDCHSDKAESSDSEHEEMASYEQKRRENILRNLAFMDQVGMSSAKLAARTAISDEFAKAAAKARRQEIVSKRALELSKLPRRKSRRISGEKVNDGRSQALDYSMELLYMKTRRQTCGSTFVDALDDDGKRILKTMMKTPDTCAKGKAFAHDDNLDYSLDFIDNVKAVPFEIRAMAFLPRADRVVLACGDKEGYVSFWSDKVNYANGESIDSSVAMYRPHGFPISQLIFPDSTRLISSSYDGTVREFDLWTSQTSLVSETETGYSVTSLAGSANSQFYYAGCADGTLRVVDRRARRLQSISYALHEMRINTLDQHPSLDYCFVTASKDRTVCLWDKRRISSAISIPLTTIRHADAVECAYFSPYDGESMVTVSQDAYINMFRTSDLAKRIVSDPLPIKLPCSARVRLNQYSKSKRLLLSPWDPKRKNRLAFASVDQEPSIKLFRAGQYQPIRELTSRNFNPPHPVNVLFHPYLDVIASGNHGDQVSLWRAKEK